MNGILKRCFESKMPVEIVYLDSNGKFTQRTIMIQAITEDSIKALCLLRNQKRTFKVDNILTVSPYKKRTKLQGEATI